MFSRYCYIVFLTILNILFFTAEGNAQTVIWIEDFDDGGGGRWTLENAPGSLTNPTPLGIVGLTYGTNAAVAHDNFIINDRNTPELDNDIVVGTSISAQGQLVRGRHYDCPAPSNLPNPFINAAQPGPNQSLHITAYPTCATLLYAGTAQSDDWNCISDPDNGDIQTQSEQIAYLNNNIDATGKCNLVLTADFFLGGDTEGQKSHGTILYSIDAGATWKILEDTLSDCYHFHSGTCNNWYRRSFAFPADANNQNDLRIAFRWYDDGDINDTGDYALGASFNVDNVMISACDVPDAAFMVSQTSGCKGDLFYFTDQSEVGEGIYSNCFSLLSDVCEITGWTWDITKTGPPGGYVYVNGTNANSQNPQVQFTDNGTYTVTLTATNCAGDGILVETDMIVIADCPPTANFITSQVAACADPASSQDTVTFTDLSTSPFAPFTSWSWTFTPATVTYVNGTSSSDQNIDVTFDTPGTYQVELTVTTSEGSDTETKVAYIEALDCNCGGAGGGGPVVVFEEDFDGNGGAGSNWSVTDEAVGAQGDIPSQWYISDAEAGNAPDNCGSAGGGDKSLHVSTCTCYLGDLGAAYEIGAGFCGFFPGVCPIADKRSYSVNINTTGVTGMTMTFNYIEGGEGLIDDAIVEYSTNGGASWSTLANPGKTAVVGGCGGQGWWTAYSVPLPASCENIANLRIGFRWYNNDGGGVDPSFAVDDIVITGTSGGGASAKTWEGDVSSVWNLAGNWSDNAIPTSSDDVLVPATLCGSCVMPQIGAAAVANNVCNFGVITINTDNTLTIDGDLLNEGQITTTTTNPVADVIFANNPSVYKGSGTLYDVDVSVASNDLTLETNMWPRSMNISTSGTFDIVTYTLSVNKDVSKTAGTFTAINGEVHFIDACGTCLDQTNTSDVTINANQIFGNILVNKSAGIKTSFMSNFNYTLNTPKTVTIQSGILDANTFTLNGTGNLTMTGGELQLAKCATVLPELTGTYTLPAGKIRFDGTCGQSVKQTSVVGTDYFKIQFDGSGIKSLTGNTVIADSLLFTLPTATGNYIDAGTDTLFVSNNSNTIVYHTGGHVVGNYNRAFTPSGGEYTFHVGSDNSDTETYFEPIRFTPNVLTGNTNLTARFLDATPNPTVVVPNIVFSFPFNPDTVQQVETEGYWHFGVTNPVIGGNYTASVSPDVTFWSFAHPWGTGAHTLLKQETEGDSWDYTAGGARVDDSTTMTFSDFSNYALGYTNNGGLTILPVEIVDFNMYCEEGVTYLSWATVSEENLHSFLIERTLDGQHFELIGQVPAAGNSNSLLHYTFRDEVSDTRAAYYRLSELDINGEIGVYGSLYADCSEDDNDFNVNIFPNPGAGAMNISIFAPERCLGAISIVDMTGKVVFRKDQWDLNKGFNLDSYTLDLKPGIYNVVVNLGTEQLMQRYVVAE